MSLYERVVSKILEASLKKTPGLDQGTTKLSVGLVVVGPDKSAKNVKYTIAKIDRRDPDNVLYTIRAFGRDGSTYGGKYEKIINSEEIKKYNLG